MRKSAIYPSLSRPTPKGWRPTRNHLKLATLRANEALNYRVSQGDAPFTSELATIPGLKADVGRGDSIF